MAAGLEAHEDIGPFDPVASGPGVCKGVDFGVGQPGFFMVALAKEPAPFHDDCAD
jgi:hypothetical protein